MKLPAFLENGEGEGDFETAAAVVDISAAATISGFVSLSALGVLLCSNLRGGGESCHCTPTRASDRLCAGLMS